MAKLRNLSAIAGVVALAILAAGWFLLVSPQRSQAAKLRSDADSTRSQSSALETKLAMLKAQAKGLPKQQARLNAISVKVPSNPAEPALVRMLTKAASEAGVDLTSIVPAQPALVTSVAPAAATSAAGTAGAAVAVPATRVASIALSITAVGRYSELMQFQANLESLSRALKSTSIALAPGGGPSTAKADAATSSGYDGKITATISAQVYMTVEGASTAPLTSTGATAPAPTK